MENRFYRHIPSLNYVTAVFSQDAVFDLRGTWKGESETIILGGEIPIMWHLRVLLPD